MKPVICFGEALIDFLNISADSQGGLSLNNYRQYPGGAPANASVAVAKLGGDTQFAGQVGDDAFGHFLRQALEHYGVDTSKLFHHPSAKTAMAFVMLDQDGERSFEFYREQTADILFSDEQASPDWFAQPAILHLCSNTLTDPNIAAVTLKLAEMARNNQGLVSFDVNLRANLWPDCAIDVERVNQLAKRCQLIKFSLEELEILAQGDEPRYTQQLFDSGVELILVTDGPNPVRYLTARASGEVASPKVTAVDTNASGDTFIGGFLRCLSELENITGLAQNPALLESMLGFATRCSAITVTRQGAFTAMPSFTEVEAYWPL
jgi:fructokinase